MSTYLISFLKEVKQIIITDTKRIISYVFSYLSLTEQYLLIHNEINISIHY